MNHESSSLPSHSPCFLFSPSYLSQSEIILGPGLWSCANLHGFWGPIIDFLWGAAVFGQVGGMAICPTTLRGTYWQLYLFVVDTQTQGLIKHWGCFGILCLMSPITHRYTLRWWIPCQLILSPLRWAVKNHNCQISHISVTSQIGKVHK